MLGRCCIAVIPAILAAALLPGCANTADKAGGAGGDEPRVLHMANSSFRPYELQAFADEVHRRSAGRLRIEFENEWRVRELGFEAGILADVKAGKVDLAWIGARAFPALGVHSFDALLAPFLIDSYTLEQRAVEVLGGEMLGGVDGLGVHAVGLLPGPLQRVIARAPVKDDVAGRRLLVQRADIERAAVRALGAVPVQGRFDTLAGLDGAVQSMIAIAGNSYQRDARYITGDLSFWPRPSVLLAGPAAWESLSDAERSLLREAARAAVPAAVTALRDRDADATADVCSTGARLVNAGPRGREAMRAGVEPVYARLREDPATANGIDAIERMRGAAEPEMLPACATAPAESTGDSGIPVGSYSWTYRDGDEPEIPAVLAGPRSIRYRLVIEPGHLVQYESADGAPEVIGFDADYTLYRDRITTDEGNGTTMTMRWSFDGRRLRFTDIGGLVDDKFVWGARPWVKAAP